MSNIQIAEKTKLTKTAFTDDGDLFLDLIKIYNLEDMLSLGVAVKDLENQKSYSNYVFQTLPNN